MRFTFYGVSFVDGATAVSVNAGAYRETVYCGNCERWLVPISKNEVMSSQFCGTRD